MDINGVHFVIEDIKKKKLIDKDSKLAFDIFMRNRPVIGFPFKKIIDIRVDGTIKLLILNTKLIEGKEEMLYIDTNAITILSTSILTSRNEKAMEELVKEMEDGEMEEEEGREGYG